VARYRENQREAIISRAEVILKITYLLPLIDSFLSTQFLGIYIMEFRTRYQDFNKKEIHENYDVIMTDATFN